MFNFSVEIYDFTAKAWTNYTKYAVMPLKFGDLLDERLDEANIFLRRCPTEYFTPNTPVKITITQNTGKPYSAAALAEITARSDRKSGNHGAVQITHNADGTITQSLSFYCVIASDRATNIPHGVRNKNGQLTYEHEIYLIEDTKIMEGFIGESITFTNARGNNYTGD